MVSIEQIQSGLYEKTFHDIAEHLSYGSLRDMSDRDFRYLVILYNEAKSHNTYPNRDSAQLMRLINRLKEISQATRA